MTKRMADSATAPVIAGLAIGIAFVVMLSLVSFPVAALTDEELIEKTKKLKEVQLFLEMHPDAEIFVERHNDTFRAVEVHYSVTKQIMEPTRFDSGIRTKVLVVVVGTGSSFDDDTASFTLVCDRGERSSMTFHASMDAIANECIVGQRPIPAEVAKTSGNAAQ